ncbi:MAG: hypothetical protein HY716_01685 [Planctomycetes bacterium]|nr:hypothetical protein [Planctomycetota bacterium]
MEFLRQPGREIQSHLRKIGVTEERLLAESPLGERRVVRLAADANVLLSAVLGHAAFRAIDEGKVDLVTTLDTLAEVREHLPDVAQKYALDLDTLKTRLQALGVVAYGPRKYRSHLLTVRPNSVFITWIRKKDGSR